MTVERMTGLLLAAGGGSRMGQPKALVLGDDGVPWVVRGVRLLLAAGCSPAVVVIGAEAAEVEAVLAREFGVRPDVVAVVRADDWATGMAASLRAGLAAASAASDAATPVEATGPAAAVEPTGVREARTQTRAVGVLVTLVDLPDLRVEAITRVRERALSSGRPEHALVRATYGGHPGHPVFIGREHWQAVAAEISGDAGAGRYLRAHGAQSVDCSDLGGGDDRDYHIP